MAGVFGLGFLTAQYLQLALHYNPLGVGLRLLPATGMALLLAPIAGGLADRIGERPLVMLGLGLQATGLLLIGALVTDSSGYRTIVGPLFIAGAGIAIAFPTVTTAVMRSVGPDETAVASGISNTFRQVGSYRTGRRRTQPRLHHPRRPVRNRGARGSPAPAGAQANPRTALMATPPRRAQAQIRRVSQALPGHHLACQNDRQPEQQTWEMPKK